MELELWRLASTYWILLDVFKSTMSLTGSGSGGGAMSRLQICSEPVLPINSNDDDWTSAMWQTVHTMLSTQVVQALSEPMKQDTLPAMPPDSWILRWREEWLLFPNQMLLRLFQIPKVEIDFGENGWRRQQNRRWWGEPPLMRRAATDWPTDEERWPTIMMSQIDNQQWWGKVTMTGR